MAAASMGIEVKGLNSLRRAMTAVGDKDAPFLRDALGEGGRLLTGEVRGTAPRHIVGSVAFTGLSGVGASTRAVVKATAKDAARFEFGRSPKPYRTRGSAKGKRATFNLKRRTYSYHGQNPRPYFGIKSEDQAIGRAKPRIQQLISDAFPKEFDRVAGQGD